MSPVLRLQPLFLAMPSKDDLNDDADGHNSDQSSSAASSFAFSSDSGESLLGAFRRRSRSVSADSWAGSSDGARNKSTRSLGVQGTTSSDEESPQRRSRDDLLRSDVPRSKRPKRSHSPSHNTAAQSLGKFDSAPTMDQLFPTSMVDENFAASLRLARPYFEAAVRASEARKREQEAHMKARIKRRQRRKEGRNRMTMDTPRSLPETEYDVRCATSWVKAEAQRWLALVSEEDGELTTDLRGADITDRTLARF